MTQVSEVQQLQDELGWTDETALELILDFLNKEGNEDLKQMVVSHLSDIAHAEMLADTMDYYTDLDEWTALPADEVTE